MRIKKILIFFVTITLFVFLFGCENTNEEKVKEKAVPVYQGMQVTDVLETKVAYYTPLYFSSANGDNDSHDEENDNQDEDEIDQEDPYDNFDGTTIEDEVEEKIGVITSEDVEYYTTKNKDFYITVKLLNPDNFVILSFTLNGVFYQSYQFQEGSDSENLILKVNSGDVSGIKDYTIDAIKYIDGTEIKDAIFAGDRTVKVGVTYDALPYATVSNLKIDTTSVSLNAQVADPANLIELYESPLKIYLYDGENLIREKDLVVGDNEVAFDKLKQDTLYQYAIVTSYDSLDGKENQIVILEKHAFYTNKMINLTDIKETQDSVEFNLIIDDTAEAGSLTSIELYKDNELVESLEDLTLKEFTGLLSNNLYEIKVVYKYDLNDGVGEQTATATHQATTKSKATPTVEIVDVVETQDTITFGLNIADTDSVGVVTSIKLFKGTEEVQSLEDLTLKEFTGLLSNNLYEIKVVYKYDLNDGVGEQTATATHQATTKSKATPTVEIVDVVETQDTITFGLNIADTDSVGVVTSIKLFKGTEEVQSLEDLTLKEFTGLLSNNLYEIKVVYKYDLNDGVGEQTATATHQATTKSKATPTVEIVDVVETQDTITFGLNIADTDSVGVVTSIKLFKGTEEVQSLEDLTLKEFTGLLSNNLYEIKVVYKYDLNDGVGEQTATATHETATLAEPIEITGINILNTSYPKVGEELHVRVLYDNPSKLDIKAFYVNNQKVDVLTSNTQTSAIIKFIPEFDGGIYEVFVTAINYLSFSQMKHQVVSSVYRDDILILGNIEIISIQEENGLDYFVYGEENHIIINFENPTGYDINEVVLNNEKYSHSEIQVIGNDIIKVKYKGYISNSTEINVNSITYGIIGEEYKTISNINKVFYGVNSSIVRNISSIEELYNMESGYVYKLVNDIDALGFNWIPYDFSGVLYGNGFTIKNLAIAVQNESMTEQRFGLFSTLRGKIDSLIIVETYISVKTFGMVNLGLISGESYESEISDIKIIDTTIIVDTQSSTFVGGIVGLTSNSKIFNVSISNISINIISGESSRVTSIGGIIGRTSNQTIVLNSNVINITVNSKGRGMWIGGLIGFHFSGIVVNTYVYNLNLIIEIVGDKTNFGSYVVGGLIGESGIVSPKVENSVIIKSKMTIKDENNYLHPIYGTIAAPHVTATITNSYTSKDFKIIFNENEVNYNYENKISEELNSKSFYVIVLGWDEQIWDFTDLDYEKGQLPTLK